MLSDQGKISSVQLAYMMIPAILATSILSIPSLSVGYAGHDMWMTPLLGSLAGLITIGVSLGLQRLYPGHTLIQVCNAIFGRYIGRVFGFVFLFYLPHLTGLVIQVYGNFIVSNALPKTPLIVIMGSMVLVCAINVRLGIEVVGRTSQVFVTVFFVLLGLTFVLLIRELDPAELLPFMENGVLSIAKGSLAPAAWFSEYIMLAFLLPFINDHSHTTKTLLGSWLLVVIAMIITNLFCLLLMGDLTDSFTFPVMIAARYITIADFMQHIEAVIIAIWIFGIFVKISVFLYAFVSSTAEWFGLKDYRPLVFPASVLCIGYAYWVTTGKQGADSLIRASSNIYTLMFLLVIPAVLYGIAGIKRVWGNSRKGARAKGGSA